MDNATKSRLETLLRRAQLLMGISSQPSPSSALQDVFNKICSLVFDEPGYRALWDEPLLTQLSWLFQAKPPNPTVFRGGILPLHNRSKPGFRSAWSRFTCRRLRSTSITPACILPSSTSSRSIRRC
jgi:hypothetical protein